MSVCRRHADRPAVDLCSVCHADLCVVCARSLAGAVYCPEHFTAAYRRRRTVGWSVGLGLVVVATTGAVLGVRHLRAEEAEAKRYGDQRPAIEQLRAALAKDVCNRDNARSLATLLTDTGHPDEAAESLDATVAACPPDLETTREALRLHRLAGNRARAMALAEQAVKDHPGDAEGYATRGLMRLENGDEGGVADLRQAVALDPGHEGAAKGLADRIERGDPCGAADLLDDLVGFRSPPDEAAIRERSLRLRSAGSCKRERIEGGVAVVPFDRRNDVMVVTVMINGEPARLLLDTGASMVALSAEFAEQAGIDWRDRETFWVGTAGGVTRARRVKLDSVALGGARVEGVQGAVIPALGRDDGVDGLLGNTFLSHFEVSVDAGACQIRLARKAAASDR